MHMGGGRYIRNQWGFWKGTMALTEQESEQTGKVPELPALAGQIHSRTGLVHADDMSGFILRRAYEEITGQKVNMYTWLRSVRNHWIQNGESTNSEYAPFKKQIYTYAQDYRKDFGGKAEENGRDSS